MRELQSVRMLWRRPSLALRMWWTERPGVGMCFPCFMWNLDLNWKVCACPSHRGCEWVDCVGVAGGSEQEFRLGADGRGDAVPVGSRSSVEDDEAGGLQEGTRCQ
jgi:hypothetical protein